MRIFFGISILLHPKNSDSLPLKIFVCFSPAYARFPPAYFGACFLCALSASPRILLICPHFAANFPLHFFLCRSHNPLLFIPRYRAIAVPPIRLRRVRFMMRFMRLMKVPQTLCLSDSVCLTVSVCLTDWRLEKRGAPVTVSWGVGCWRG